jgi:hypothetical protein
VFSLSALIKAGRCCRKARAAAAAAAPLGIGLLLSRTAAVAAPPSLPASSAVGSASASNLGDVAPGLASLAAPAPLLLGGAAPSFSKAVWRTLLMSACTSAPVA